MVKIVTRICNVISVLMVVIILAIGVTMVAPRMMGNDIYAVMSGSMEPYYHVGSLVIVDKKIKPEEIQLGDPITFYKGDNAIATHRVVAVDSEKKEFTTKGDANEDIDVSPVSFNSLIGRAGLTIPYLGYLPLYMRTPKGIFGIATVIVIFILLQIIPEIVKPEEPKEKGVKSDEKQKKKK